MMNVDTIPMMKMNLISMEFYQQVISLLLSINLQTFQLNPLYSDFFRSKNSPDL